MSAPLFELRGIVFAHRPERPVLRGVDFTLRPGERVALRGPNGAGKTSLLHVMLGLLRPQAGEVTAFGARRRSEADFRPVRARAGLLFQDSDDQLFCPTVIEDVAFGPLHLGATPAQARARAQETLAALGLAGFDDRVTHALSGGEKRLVALASVLAMRPDVLLLDEPTNALDDAARERLLAALSQAPQAMVVISHDLDAARRLATRWVYLSDGLLTAHDPC